MSPCGNYFHRLWLRLWWVYDVPSQLQLPCWLMLLAGSSSISAHAQSSKTGSDGKSFSPTGPNSISAHAIAARKGSSFHGRQDFNTTVLQRILVARWASQGA